MSDLFWLTDVQPLPRRSRRLHTGIRLGEGTGREPGRRCPTAVLRAPAKVQELRRAQRMARGSLRCLGQSQSAPRASGSNDLGGLPGRAHESCALRWSIRRLPCRAGIGLEDLPSGSTRTATPWTAGPLADLSRSVPMPSGSSSGRTGRSWGSMPGPSDATRRFTIRCTTFRFWLASPVPSGTARPSRIGTCRRRSGVCSASLARCRTETRRWSRSSA